MQALALHAARPEKSDADIFDQNCDATAASLLSACPIEAELKRKWDG
jgi:hypothetical protein